MDIKSIKSIQSSKFYLFLILMGFLLGSCKGAHETPKNPLSPDDIDTPIVKFFL